LITSLQATLSIILTAKDLINRPNKSMLDRLVSPETKLNVLFAEFFMVAIGFVYIMALSSFSTYIFLIWFYSHKIKKYPVVGNLTAALLAVIPFCDIIALLQHFLKKSKITRTFAVILMLAFFRC
jgi:4-hydroxybenzoate polyprenyltransferase